jgi:hypothetical protein
LPILLLPRNYEGKYHDNLLLPLISGRMSQVASTGKTAAEALVGCFAQLILKDEGVNYEFSKEYL